MQVSWASRRVKNPFAMRCQSLTACRISHIACVQVRSKEIKIEQPAAGHAATQVLPDVGKDDKTEHDAVEFTGYTMSPENFHGFAPHISAMSVGAESVAEFGIDGREQLFVS